MFWLIYSQERLTLSSFTLGRETLGLAAASSTSSSSSSSAPSPAPAAPAPPAGEWRPIRTQPRELRSLLSTLALADQALLRYELRISPDATRLRALVTLGERACGHPGIVHGGALAAVLDDAFGALFFHSGVGSGFTANLNVDYVRPVPAGTELSLELERVRVEPSKSGASRKVFMQARVAAAADEREVFTRATALFIAKDHAPGALLELARRSASEADAAAADLAPR